MHQDIDLAKKFISGFFKKNGSWDNDVAPFVEGDGGYEHPLKIPSIKAAYDSLNDSFYKVFPDLNQIVQSSGILDNGNIILKTIASATFSGDFGDIKANGQTWEIPVYWEFQIKNGKIIHASELASHLAINDQLKEVLIKSPFELQQDTKNSDSSQNNWGSEVK